MDATAGGLQNQAGDAIAVVENFFVGETQNLVAALKQKIGAAAVCTFHVRIVVVNTIRLNYQSCGMAYEVSDVWTYRGLPPKRQTVQPMRAQHLPQGFFGPCHPASHLFRVASRCFRYGAMWH